MQTKLNSSDHTIYLCQNCATRFTPPQYKEEPMVLVHDEEYYWVSRVRRNKMIQLEKCCDLPYIEEMQ